MLLTPREQAAFIQGIETARQMAMVAAVSLEIRDDAGEVRQRAAVAALQGLAEGLRTLMQPPASCGTPGCAASARRVRGGIAVWEDERAASEIATVQCDAVADVGSAAEADPALSPEPSTRPREGVQNGRAEKNKAGTTRRPAEPQEPAHRPVAERRAAVEAMLSEGLSDRAIARAVKVSPSTVAAVRRDRGNANPSIEVNR